MLVFGANVNNIIITLRFSFTRTGQDALKDVFVYQNENCHTCVCDTVDRFTPKRPLPR